MIQADTHTKTLFAWLCVALLLASAATYYRTMAVRDFPVTNTAMEEAAGDPAI
ncbi:MAG: hypothetical protein HYT30_00790 [Parcubacteria group bacterium]|nr:hypothetical protein [Parcubacteria group bacterium]